MKKRPDKLVIITAGLRTPAITALLYDVINFSIRRLDVCLFVSWKLNLIASTSFEHPPVRGKNVEITTSLVLSSMHLCDFASVTQPPTLLQPRPRRLLLGRGGLASS